MILQPERDCALCPRLAGYRRENRAKFPDKFNAPVPSFGPEDAGILIVGLAPGLKGANFTGRPFTGDHAGDLLYATLLKFGLAEGEYKARADDGLTLKGVRITNAVRCVPPQNKPETSEIKNCAPFFSSEIEALPNVKVLIALGLIAHNTVLRHFGMKLSAHKFGHGAIHTLSSHTLSSTSSLPKQESGGLNQPGSGLRRNDIILLDSYHCSRYNTQTGRLTPAMFEAIFETALARSRP